MNNRCELTGLVKPYFGRSVSRETAATAPASAAPSPLPSETESALEAVVLPSSGPKDAIREAVQIGGWMMTETEESWDIAVPVGSERSQIVSVQFGRRDEGRQPLVVYSSRCGPVSNKNAMVLLRRNAHMFQMAFAIEKQDDITLVVLRGVQRSVGAESAEAVRMIEAIAKHSDSVERKLAGTDEF